MRLPQWARAALFLMTVMLTVGIASLLFSDNKLATTNASAPSTSSADSTAPSANSTSNTDNPPRSTTAVTQTTVEETPVATTGGTSPDGTPLDENAPSYTAPPQPTSSTPSTPTSSPATTTAPLLNVAEDFVREYYTVHPGETAESWVQRVSPYMIPELRSRMSGITLDGNRSNVVTVPKNLEIPGTVDDNFARLNIRFFAQQFENGQPLTEEPAPFSINVTLINTESGWYVTDIYP